MAHRHVCRSPRLVPCRRSGWLGRWVYQQTHTVIDAPAKGTSDRAKRKAGSACGRRSPDSSQDGSAGHFGPQGPGVDRIIVHFLDAGRSSCALYPGQVRIREKDQGWLSFHRATSIGDWRDPRAFDTVIFSEAGLPSWRSWIGNWGRSRCRKQSGRT